MTVIGGIIAILICLLINMIVMPHFLWVFYVAVAVFYLVVSLNHTILSAAHLGGKITAQVVSLTVLLLVIDGMSGSVQWSVNYVVPFVIIAGILLISIIIIKVRLKWTGYVSFTHDDCTWLPAFNFVFFRSGKCPVAEHIGSIIQHSYIFSYAADRQRVVYDAAGPKISLLN